MPKAAETDHIEGSAAVASLLSNQPPSSALPKPSPLGLTTTNDEKDPDPHNLHSRYVVNQKLMFHTALSEINHGSKESCWLWFMLPTAPFIVNGREKGSSTNRHFALRGDDAAKAYLRFPPQKFSITSDKTITISLQQNYLRIAKAVLHQLRDKKNTPPRLFGDVDSPKAKGSLELFHRVASEMEDQQEIVSVCEKILALDLSWKFSFDSFNV